jgi:plasmid stabilization system protein ParE
MDFKLIFKDSFVNDLQQIIVAIAEINPDVARKLGDSIISKAESLVFFPERFPLVRQRRGIRRLIVMEHFKVFYRVLENTKTVEILRLWDGRKKFDPPVYQ